MGQSFGSGNPQNFDRLEGKVASSPQRKQQIEEVYKLYARTDHIGKSRAKSFARDLVLWHIEKKRISTNVDINREVFHVLYCLNTDRNGRLYMSDLTTPPATEIIYKYRFTRNRRRTEHVIQATLDGMVTRRAVEIIVSYTSDWGFHKGRFIGYGTKNGYWRNGWGSDTFSAAEPHILHAPSHFYQGDGLSHWTCCGSVDKLDSFCISQPAPVHIPSSRRSRRQSPATSEVSPENRASVPQVTPSSRNNRSSNTTPRGAKWG